MKISMISLMAVSLTIPLLSMENPRLPFLDELRQQNVKMKELARRASEEILPEKITNEPLQIQFLREYLSEQTFNANDSVLNTLYPLPIVNTFVKDFVKPKVALFQECSLNEINKLPEDVFDKVLSFFWILYEKDKETLFSKIYKVLVDGGLFLTVFYGKSGDNDPVYNASKETFEKYKDKLNEQTQKEFEFVLNTIEKGTDEYYEQIIKDAGFANVKISTEQRFLELEDFKALCEFGSRWARSFFKALDPETREEAISTWAEVFLKKINYSGEGPIFYPSSNFIIEAKK